MKKILIISLLLCIFLICCFNSISSATDLNMYVQGNTTNISENVSNEATNSENTNENVTNNVQITKMLQTIQVTKQLQII